MRVGLQDIVIQDIRLEKEQREENDPLARVVVLVQIEGVWYEVIRELASTNFDHTITANGIASIQRGELV